MASYLQGIYFYPLDHPMACLQMTLEARGTWHDHQKQYGSINGIWNLYDWPRRLEGTNDAQGKQQRARLAINKL